jgi:soluble lytic murein transglycosylase-like protein
MAKSHPAQFDDQGVPQLAQWARNTVASFTLMACLASLGIILHIQYGVRLASAIVHGLGALDLAQLVNLNDAPAAPAVTDANEGKYRAVGDYLARRYRVSSEMTTDVVAKAHAIGAELKIDPMLILAVIAVESRFNPVAESVMGAKGLMQVIPRYHTDKFDPLGGEKVAFDLQANILVGAKILKEYIRRTGDIADALQLYVGASSDENENGYSGKVIAERERLNQILRQFQSQNRTAQHQPVVKQLAASI